MATKAPKLGFLMVVCLVLGNMIGSGIFLLPASLAPYGSVGLLGWFFSAAGAILLAFTFAFLARTLPRTGGIYAYAREGFGDYVGFLTAWGYWVAIWAGNAAIAVAMVGYLGYFLPVLTKQPLLGAVVAVSALWLLALVNARGLRQAGWIQVVTTFLKILPLIAVAFGGCLFLKPDYFLPLNPSGGSLAQAVTSAATLTLWAFMGIESATIPAEDVRNPKITIPRATILGALLAAAIYILATVAVMGSVPREVLAQSSAPFADAAKILAGNWAGHAVAIGALFATFGALNGWILLSGQIPFAAARDGLFPKFLAKRNRLGAPQAGLFVAASASTPIILLSYHRSLVAQFSFIILLATLTALVPYLFSTMAALLLVHDEKNRKLRRRVGIVAGLAFLYSIWAIAGAGRDTVYWGFLLLMAGTPIYVWMRRQSGNPMPHIRENTNRNGKMK